MTTPDSRMLAVGTKKQLFFDDVLLYSVENVKRTIHTPERADANPLIESDRPWEAVTYFSPGTWNLFYDETDGLFKCWYGDWHYDAEREAEIEGLHDDRIRLLYAESEDGVEWSKPPVGQREDGRETNVVLGGADDEFGVQTSYVVRDPAAEDPEERYKTLFRRITPKDDPTKFERVIRAARSPDGIDWTVLEDPPESGLEGSVFGDVFSMTYDSDSRTWVSYVRAPDMGHASDPDIPRADGFLAETYPLDFAMRNTRRIYRAESGDFHHWSDPREVLRPDERDNLDEQMYGMRQYRVPGSDFRVGFVNVLRGVDNTLHVQLAYSRDGEEWRRFGNRQPWLDTSESGWDRHMVNVMCEPVRVGDELRVYYGGARNHHDWWLTARKEGVDPEEVPEAYDRDRVGYGLEMATLRPEGFVSLDTRGPYEGIVVTRPLLTDGRELVVNAACDAGGSLEVAVADRDNDPFEGYEWRDCGAFTGDSLSHTLSWNGTTTLPDADYYRLQIRMSDASLYALSFR